MLTKIDRGILYMLAGALISALNGALTKVLAEYMSAMEIVFFRSIIGVVIILYALKHTAPTLPGGKFYMLISRGVYGILAMILYFYTIKVIPLGEAITLNSTSPLFGSILAFYLLQEHLNKRTILALVIGFFGIVFIVKPFGMMISYEHFLGILGGFFAAAAYTTIKKIKDIYDARIIVLSFSAVGTLLPGLFFLIAPYIEAPESISFLFPEFIMPSTMYVWFLIVMIALISTLSQWLITKAYSTSNVSIIGVISYTIIPFSIAFGWMLGDPLPDALTYLGIGFIVVGGVLVGMKKKEN